MARGEILTRLWTKAPKFANQKQADDMAMNESLRKLQDLFK